MSSEALLSSRFSRLMGCRGLVLLLLVSCACVSGSHQNILTVGYLANIHGKSRQGHIISGAMTYAIKEANKNLMAMNYTLEFVYEDTRGETLAGTNAVINMWREGIIAFFGPENSCEVEATVAASLNLPMISYVSTYLILYFTIRDSFNVLFISNFIFLLILWHIFTMFVIHIA